MKFRIVKHTFDNGEESFEVQYKYENKDFINVIKKNWTFILFIWMDFLIDRWSWQFKDSCSNLHRAEESVAALNWMHNKPKLIKSEIIETK